MALELDGDVHNVDAVVKIIDRYTGDDRYRTVMVENYA